MPRQPEGKLVVKIKDKIVDAGGRPFKIQGSEDSHQEIGIPDLLCCITGRFVGIEVKQPGEKLRPLQRLTLNEIYAAGGVAAVCETVEQVVGLLEIIERESHHQRPICYDRGKRRPRGVCRFR